MKKLKRDIIDYLSTKLHKSEATIRKNISLKKRDYPSCTSNAVGQIYAREYGLSVLGKLDSEDKKSLPNLRISKPIVITRKRVSRKKEIIKKIVDYETDDYFKKSHVQEVNKAYSKGCYTAVYILSRKIIENLVIDILRQKFPPISKTNKELYYNTHKGRYKDFSIILRNLYDKRTSFAIDDKKIIERLHDKIKNLKKNANDQTHSWFYVVKRKTEVDDIDLQTVIELIKKLEISVGLRK